MSVKPVEGRETRVEDGPVKYGAHFTGERWLMADGFPAEARRRGGAEGSAVLGFWSLDLEVAWCLGGLKGSQEF